MNVLHLMYLQQTIENISLIAQDLITGCLILLELYYLISSIEFTFELKTLLININLCSFHNKTCIYNYRLLLIK